MPRRSQRQRPTSRPFHLQSEEVKTWMQDLEVVRQGEGGGGGGRGGEHGPDRRMNGASFCSDCLCARARGSGDYRLQMCWSAGPFLLCVEAGWQDGQQ